MGKAAVVRWVLFGLDWRTTALIADNPYADTGKEMKRANKVGSSAAGWGKAES